jgi:hypothetical protein
MALSGLQPFEPVTSALAFDLTLLAAASGTPEVDAVRHDPAPPDGSAQPPDALPTAISGDEMVKWFGILGFIMLLTRGTRRR